jgi:hypothetical protein
MIKTGPDDERKFCGGKDKRMLSARVPTRLIEELEAIRERTGKPMTEIIIDALDFYSRAKAEQRKRT